MAKRRKSYRAYAPGSVQKRITAHLKYAVSELRQGDPKGCLYAKQNVDKAVTLYYDALPLMAPRTSRVQGVRIVRVIKAVERKCRR